MTFNFAGQSQSEGAMPRPRSRAISDLLSHANWRSWRAVEPLCHQRFNRLAGGQSLYRGGGDTNLSAHFGAVHITSWVTRRDGYSVVPSRISLRCR